jgi:hypothetical protein
MSSALDNRIDIVSLSTETKPTKNLKNGSTLYEVDTASLYIWYEGNWYDDAGMVVQPINNSLQNNLPKEAITEKVEKTQVEEVTENDDK